MTDQPRQPPEGAELLDVTWHMRASIGVGTSPSRQGIGFPVLLENPEQPVPVGAVIGMLVALEHTARYLTQELLEQVTKADPEAGADLRNWWALNIAQQTRNAVASQNLRIERDSQGTHMLMPSD